jgi:hypothetical protein
VSPGTLSFCHKTIEFVHNIYHFFTIILIFYL